MTSDLCLYYCKFHFQLLCLTQQLWCKDNTPTQSRFQHNSIHTPWNYMKLLLNPNNYIRREIHLLLLQNVLIEVVYITIGSLNLAHLSKSLVCFLDSPIFMRADRVYVTTRATNRILPLLLTFLISQDYCPFSLVLLGSI